MTDGLRKVTELDAFKAQAAVATQALYEHVEEINRLEAQLAERDAQIADLKEALQPFAQMSKLIKPEYADDDDWITELTVGDLRRARSAYERK